MAALRRRGERWQARVRRGGFNVTETFTLKADAIRWARGVEADIESGRWAEKVQAVPVAEPVPSLAEAIKLYQAGPGSKLKGSKEAGYKFARMLDEPFTLKPINEVGARDLADYLDRRAASRTAGTVLRDIGLLSSVFTWAVKDRAWLDQNPLTRVRKPRAPNGRDRVLTPEEMDWLMLAARSSRAVWLAPALTVLAHSAMRRGELVQLKAANVDLPRGVAYLIDTKNGCDRPVPCCPKTRAGLGELIREAQARGRALLVPVRAGTVSTRFTATVKRARALYEADCARSGRAADAAVLADLRVHDLRHHAITTWAERGLSLVELMTISGHKTARMLTRYAHINAGRLAEKLAKLDNA